MTKCTATNQNGEPCAAFAINESRFCFFHDPASASRRAESHRRGGMTKATPHAADSGDVPGKIRDLNSVLMLLDYATAESLALPNGVARNRLLAALSSSYVEVLQVGELEARLATLETLVAKNQAEGNKR